MTRTGTRMLAAIETANLAGAWPEMADRLRQVAEQLPDVSPRLLLSFDSLMRRVIGDAIEEARAEAAP